MNTDNIQPTSLENLPVEIFLKVFSSLSLQEIVTAFFDLNSYINSVIQCVTDRNHAVTYNDTKAVELVHSFPTQICRLIITFVPNVDFVSLKNLRSLTIMYGTIVQLNGIRPQHFPMLEILRIRGTYRASLIDKVSTISNLFQVILSNGFRQLRICTAIGIGSLDSNQMWTGSPGLHFLLLDGQTPLIYGLILSVCPNLRLSKSISGAQIDRPIGTFIDPPSRSALWQIRKIKGWESEKKFILEYCSIFDLEEPVQSLNSTATNQHFYNPMECVIRGRIFPEKDPYCFASFLIQIKLPSEYPFKMPDVIILDPIYHPNVRKDGSHCHCCGYWGLDVAEGWKPTTLLIEIIKAVINTIDNPHFKHPQNEECANEYQNDYNRYYEKALQYTSEYGRPRY